jgi:serine/threonine-protein kinase
MLTGCCPFEGATHSALIVAISINEPRPPSQLRPEVSPELEAVVLRALARDRDERYPGMNSLIEALLPFATQPRPSAELRASAVAAAAGARRSSLQGVVAAALPAESEIRRIPGQRSRSGIALAAASLLLVAAIWAWSTRKQAAEPAKRDEPAAPATATASPQPETAPAPAPAAAAAVPERRPHAEAPAPAAAPKPIAVEPAVAKTPARLGRPRATRPRPAVHENANAPRRGDATEDELFSGRK